MANENQNTNPGLNLNQQSLDLQNLRQGLKDLLDDQGDYNNLLKSSLKDLEKTSSQYKKIEDRLASLSKESINIKQINQELYKLKQKESDEQKKLTQLQSLYGKKTASSLENAKKRALEDKKFYESQGASFDLQKQILNNLQEQGNLEAVKIFTQQKQLDFAKQKTKETELALQNEKNIAKQLGLTGNSAEVLAKKLSIGNEAYATMVVQARKLLEEQKTISKLPQQKVLNSPQQAPAQTQQAPAQTQQAPAQSQAQVQQIISQAQAQAQVQQAQAQTQAQAQQAQAQQTIGQAIAQAQQTIGQVIAQAMQSIGQAQAQSQTQQATSQAQPQAQQVPLNNPQPVSPANLKIKKEELSISKSLEQSIRDSKRLQNDSNSDLNKAINLLSQINDLRDVSISKVKSLNKETINTKDIQREFQKAKQKEELTFKKLTDLEQSLGDKEKLRARGYLASIKAREILEEGIQRARLKGDINAVQSLGAQLNIVDEKIEKSEKELNLDQRRYAAAIQANKVAGETKNLLQGELNIEKEIQESVGLTGVALGKFSQKLGLGTKYSSELVEKARELNDEGKKLTFGDKLSALKKAGLGAIKETFTDPLTAIPAAAAIAAGAYKLVQSGLNGIGNAAAKAGNFMAGLSEDSSNIIRGLTSGMSDLARKIPLVGGLLGGLIDGFAALLDLVIGVDDYIVKSGRQLNMTANEARAFNRTLQDAAFNSNNVYVNSKKLLQSQVELTSQLGTTNILNKEILETNIALKDFAGLEADTRAKIAEMAITTEQTSQGTVKGILAQVEGLKKATGIEFQSQQILKEIGSQSGFIALQFSKYPKEMTKALVTVKSMGLELKQLYSIGDSFLDFESSISKEFEAQLLTGKDINLAKAREAFLNNDLVTAAQEITRQVGSSADFEKMRRIEQESLAQAMGMSVDQLSEMLRQQEILARIGGKQGDSATEQLRLARERFASEDKIKESLGEQNYQALINASAQEKIANFIDKIKQSIVDFVERTNIIEKIENFVNMLQDPTVMKGILGKIRDTISTFIKVAGELLADILEVGGHIADTFTPFSGRDYSDEAKIGAAKIRQVTAEMSGNVKSLGVETMSIEESVKKDKLSSTQAPKQVDDMSMKKAPSITFVDKSQTNIVPIDGKMMAQKNVETYFVDAQGNYYGAQTSGQN